MRDLDATRSARRSPLRAASPPPRVAELHTATSTSKTRKSRRGKGAPPPSGFGTSAHRLARSPSPKPTAAPNSGASAECAICVSRRVMLTARAVFTCSDGAVVTEFRFIAARCVPREATLERTSAPTRPPPQRDTHMGPQREDCCRRDGRALLCGEGLGARAPFWCRPRAERRHALRARTAAKGSARKVGASRAHTHGESLAPLPSCGGADTDAALSDTALSITRRTWTRLRAARRAARAISTAATLSRCRATADGRPRLHGIWCARGTSGWARWRMRCSERTLCAAPHSFSRPFIRHPRC